MVARSLSWCVLLLIKCVAQQQPTVCARGVHVCDYIYMLSWRSSEFSRRNYISYDYAACLQHINHTPESFTRRHEIDAACASSFAAHGCRVFITFLLRRPDTRLFGCIMRQEVFSLMLGTSRRVRDNKTLKNSRVAIGRGGKGSLLMRLGVTFAL
jgi:hypothetical protein